MKKISVLLALLLCLSLCGCAQTATVTMLKTGDVLPEAITDSKNYEPETVPFDPSECTVWTANCEEYVTLWVSPTSDEIITTIPKGEEMTLLGWDERYAHVTFGEEVGYVNSAYIKPADEEYFAKCLNVVEVTDTYSYEQMLSDIDIFAQKYPEIVETEIVGQSELGRDIPVIRIGNAEAETHVFLQGAIHGREHMTAWCLMAMTDYWLDNGLAEYGDICWHIIPMINPDGVVISQTGKLTEEQLKIYDSDLALEFFPEDMTEYTAQWKANGKGVDINRNFPAGWEYIDDITEPASAFFKGETEFSTAEARILRDYTLQYDFDVTISYHSSGSIIYWQYGDKQPVNDLSHELGEAVNAVTGYSLIGSDSVDGAGYKDWTMNSLEIPSLTIEIGSEDSPLSERELYSIFARNYMVLPAIAGWLQN
ncbi:MAG: hypothetical protein IJC91_02660 [Oscillospiraceae bacterium]|nr:hypothetical protein [Oscillospiraceae bacterium]